MHLKKVESGSWSWKIFAAIYFAVLGHSKLTAAYSVLSRVPPLALILKGRAEDIPEFLKFNNTIYPPSSLKLR